MIREREKRLQKGARDMPMTFSLICSQHKLPLEPKETRFGTRWSCMVSGCTVACWNGNTSTPADEETRKLRHRCHELFDPLWKKRKHGQRRSRRRRESSRSRAYRWLCQFMQLSKEDCHIGMFTAAQCRKLISYLEEVSCPNI